MKKLILLLVLIISLVFTISCVTKEVPVTETYYETEYRTESYVETGDEQRVYIKPEWTRHAWVYLAVVEWGAEGSQSVFDGYDISQAKGSASQVELELRLDGSSWAILVVDLTGLGPLSAPPQRGGLDEKISFDKAGKMIVTTTPGEEAWLANLNAITTDHRRILNLTESDQCTSRKITIDTTGVEQFMIWICTAPLVPSPIERVQLIWQSASVKETQIPYQVEKERTVLQTQKVPFWEAWKANPPAETGPSSPSATEVEPVVIETSSNVTTTEASPGTINDDFSDPNSGWGRSSDDWSKFAYEGGEYSISLERTDWFGYHLNSVSGMLEDFTVEVDAKKLSQGTDDAAGIIFRDQRGQGKDSFYVFWVDSKHGTYAIQKYIEDVWAPNLKDFTSSNYIQRGANTNRLKVVCKGSQIEVYANDNKLTTVIDSSLTSGFIGLAAETFTSSNAHYHFDNFKLHTNSH